MEMTQSSPLMNNPLNIKFDVTSWMSNDKVLILIVELSKIPSVREQMKEFLWLQLTSQSTQLVDKIEYAPSILQIMNQEGRKNPIHQPFFIFLVVGHLLLYKCMLDLGASTNVMYVNVMNQLGHKTTRPYRNIGAMDSKEVKFFGLIKDLHVSFASFHDISLTMDVVVIDVSDAQGMILLCKWDANIGVSIQMDLYYDIVPTYENTYVIVGTGADPGFNATTTHQQNLNYRPFRQHLQSR
jgi:hypothetical protein